MTECKYKELSSVACELSFVVPKERVNSYLERALQAMNQKARIKGYRPGKAPRALLLQFYGSDIRQKALEKLVSEILFETLKERSIQPVGKPKLNYEQGLEAGKDFSFSAHVEVMPEVQLQKWQELDIKQPELPQIDDAMVLEELESLRTRAALFEPVEDREVAQEGDFIELTYTEPCLAEEHHDHQHQPKQRLIELGKKAFMPEKPEIEAALLGAQLGKAIQVAGFEMTVDAIKSMKKPDLDDEFAKDLSDKFETLEDLKNDIKTKLEEDRVEQLANDKQTAIMDALIEANPIEVPDSLILEQAQHMASLNLSRFPKDMAKQMWKLYGESLLQSAKLNAERLLKADLLFRAVAKEEGLELSNQEYFEKISDLVWERAHLS